MLKDVGILLISSNRSRMYLQHLAAHNLNPSHALYLCGDENKTPEGKVRRSPPPSIPGCPYDFNVSIEELLERQSIPCKKIPVLNPNADEVVQAATLCPCTVYIYSGPGGAILRQSILNCGKRFLHVHPGIVPYFRGSTTIYYSLLMENQCGATALFLNEKIDGGPVLGTKSFPPPTDRTTIDLYYDPWIRAQLLVELLREYQLTGCFQEKPQNTGDGETYFIIHPVLKHLAIMKSR